MIFHTLDIFKILENIILTALNVAYMCPQPLPWIRFTSRISQMEIQKKTGINQAKISHFEQGYLMPTAEEKAKIAEAVGVPVSEILCDVTSTDKD